MNKKERDENVFNLYVFYGFNLVDISKKYKITRQRVHQILHKTEAQSKVVKNVIANRIEETRLKKIPNKKECYVCGKDFQPYSGMQLSCSKLHGKIHKALKYQTSNKHRSIVRKSIAKSRLKKEPNDTWSKNVLNNTVVTRQRFIKENTITFNCAVSSFILGWPIFDKFDQDIKDQIRTYAREHKNFKVIKHSDLFNY